MLCCAKVRTLLCKVILLDEQEITLEIKSNSLGQELLDSVFRHLNLLETSYFGLRFKDKENQTQWLDSTRRILRQLNGSSNFIVYFGVKFYAADPCKLHDEITRYQFFLQLKQDVLQGRLPVSLSLAAELGSYAVQSELGDYDERRHSPGYVSEFRFVSNQSPQLEEKIEEMHKELTGYLPSVAELQYLEKVKWLEMYGVDLHPVLGEDNVEYFLGLTPTGIILLRNKNKVASYTWSSIVKMMHKRKYFMLRVEDKNAEQNTYGFETPSKSACKHLYKCCIEQNAFFRLVNISPDPTMVSDQRDRSQDLKSKLRSEPDIIRSSSNRYQRRISSFNVNIHTNPPPAKDLFYKKNSPYSITTTRPLVGGWPSPRSVRSAPAPLRGLFTSSPRSVHSARHRRTPTNRSASVDSHSSEESRNYLKQKTRRRQNSDNESESSAKSRRRRNRSRRLSASGRSRSTRYDRKGRCLNPSGECISDVHSVVSADADLQSSRKLRESIRESRPRERVPADPNGKYKPFIRYVENKESAPQQRSNQRSERGIDSHHSAKPAEGLASQRSKSSKDGKMPYSKRTSPPHTVRHKHKKSQGSTTDLLKKKDIHKKSKVPHEMSTEL